MQFNQSPALALKTQTTPTSRDKVPTKESMHFTRLSKFLRLLVGCALLIGAIASGWAGRAPAVIWLLALAFSLSFIVGRWQAWSLAWRERRLRQALAGLPLTYLVQTLLVAALYLLGLGARSVFLGTPLAAALTRADVIDALILTIFAVLSGLCIAGLERAPLASASLAIELPAQTPARAEIRVLPDAVQAAHFFSGIHYSHGDYDGPNGAFNGSPNAKSAGSAEKILALESRLNVRLPKALAELYLLQNGGSVNSICVPKTGVATPRLHDDVWTPFSGYNDLNPLEVVNTLHGIICDYADPNDPDGAQQFPAGSQQMIVLARWYNETFFLDYGNAAQPRVGFVDFEDIQNWQSRCVWWRDFDEFFAACRHYQQC
jgi:hypothetical protein